MTNGNHLSLKDKAEEITKWVNELFSDEVWGYIRMTRENVAKLSQQDCAEIGYILSEQAAELQLRANKINALIKWIDHQVNIIIAPHLGNYDKYKPYNERRILSVRDNDVAMKMQNQINELEQKKESIDFLSHRIENLAQYLKEVRRSKYEPSNT